MYCLRGDIVNNFQALAYARLAMEAVGIDRETIEQVEDRMILLIDELTPEEAEQKAQ